MAMNSLYSKPRHCHRCGGECGFDACTIEHGSIMDGDLSYEYVCGACAKNDDKLKHLFNHKKEKPMKTKDRIDEDRLNALDNLIYLFAGLGLVGIIALIVKGLRALGDIAMVVVLAAVGVGGACAWIAAGAACVKWWIVG